jgi:hypothetical protein
MYKSVLLDFDHCINLYYKLTFRKLDSASVFRQKGDRPRDVYQIAEHVIPPAWLGKPRKQGGQSVVGCGTVYCFPTARYHLDREV